LELAKEKHVCTRDFPEIFTGINEKKIRKDLSNREDKGILEAKGKIHGRYHELNVCNQICTIKYKLLDDNKLCL
jgi:predicted HTH transcriptional regulator